MKKDIEKNIHLETHKDVIDHVKDCPVCMTTVWEYLIKPKIKLGN